MVDSLKIIEGENTLDETAALFEAIKSGELEKDKALVQLRALGEVRADIAGMQAGQEVRLNRQLVRIDDIEIVENDSEAILLLILTTADQRTVIANSDKFQLVKAAADLVDEIDSLI